MLLLQPDEISTEDKGSYANCLEQYHIGLVFLLADFINVIFEVEPANGPKADDETERQKALTLICLLILPRDFDSCGEKMI
jgi:hypothetical protein